MSSARLPMTGSTCRRADAKNAETAVIHQQKTISTQPLERRGPPARRQEGEQGARAG